MAVAIADDGNERSNKPKAGQYPRVAWQTHGCHGLASLGSPPEGRREELAEMRATERRIYHFDMEVRRRGHITHLPPLTDLLAVWQERSDGEVAYQDRQKGDVRFNIEKVQIYDEAMACLLISVTDKHSSDSVYSDFVTKKSTVNKKGPTQGGMFSCHLVISTIPSKPDSYFCAIEYANKLSQSNIQLLLNFVLHDEYKDNPGRFSYANVAGTKDRSGEVKRTSFLPRIELKGHISEEMIQSLERGRLTSVLLINDKVHGDFGDSPYLVETSRQITIKAKPDLPREGMFDSIASAVRTRAESYEKARIRFVAPDRAPQALDFNTSDGSIIDHRFVKSQILSGITPPLADASDAIVSRILRPMMSIVRERRGETR